MKKILILTTTIFFLIGCGSGDSDSGSNQDVEMVISESYTVYPGNKVVQGSTDTLVKITHTDGQDESTILLVEGNATIIRNP